MLNELTKVGELEFSHFTDEQILRLDVSVQDPTSVAIRKASKQLEQK